MQQLALSLFAPEQKQPERQKRHAPTWEDKQKGRAVLVDRVELCEVKQGRSCQFWRGDRCTHVRGAYAFPKKQPNDTCIKHFLVWGDEE